MNLIPRFFDVTSGRILIDGHDLRELTLGSLRRQVAQVTQETILFNDTVRNNIAYGQPEVQLQLVEEAARNALAHDFILRMPQGYDTVIGEKGFRLSGGERQRLAIARAILKNAPILILDEATSALDAESESLVQAALANLMQDRTVLVIAHRLSHDPPRQPHRGAGGRAHYRHRLARGAADNFADLSAAVPIAVHGHAGEQEPEPRE